MWNAFSSLVLPFWFGGDTRGSGDSHRVRGRTQSDVPPERPITADVHDLELIARVREGSAADARVAFDTLYDRLFDPLFRFAVRFIGDTDLARDVVQDTFVALWITRHKWYAPGGSNAYLYTAVRNRAVTGLRSANVRSRANTARIPIPTATRSPDSAIEQGEFQQAFELALESLPDRRRTAFLLYAVDGLTYDTIGQVLGISKPAAYKQVTSAIIQLRKLLSKFAG